MLTREQENPIQRAIIDKRPETVKAWRDEHYPAIAAQARAEGGEMHWGDETALTNTDVRGRSYAPGPNARDLCPWWQTGKALHDRNRHQPRQSPQDDH